MYLKNSWEEQIIMHQASGKQGEHEYLANIRSRDSKSHSLWFLSPFVFLPAWGQLCHFSCPEQDVQSKKAGGASWGKGRSPLLETEGGGCSWWKEAAGRVEGIHTPAIWEKTPREGEMPKASHRTLPSASHSPSLCRLSNPSNILQTFFFSKYFKTSLTLLAPVNL